MTQSIRTPRSLLRSAARRSNPFINFQLHPLEQRQLLSASVGSPLFSVSNNETPVDINATSTADGTDFGDVILGNSVTHTFTVTNISDHTISLTAVYARESDYFFGSDTTISWTSGPTNDVVTLFFNVAPGESFSLETTFQPGTIGPQHGALGFTYIDHALSIVPLDSYVPPVFSDDPALATPMPGFKYFTFAISGTGAVNENVGTPPGQPGDIPSEPIIDQNAPAAPSITSAEPADSPRPSSPPPQPPPPSPPP